MQNTLTIAVLAGLGGMLGWGAADFFAKKTIDKIGAIASLVWAHIFGTAILGLAVLYRALILGHEATLPNAPREWGALVFFGFLQAVVYLLVYIGFGKGKLAVLNPVFASYSGLAALLSITILGEVLSSQLLTGIAVIYAGIILLNLDTEALLKRRLKILSPGLIEVAAASVLAAVWTVMWASFVGDKDGITYALFMYMFMTVAALLIAWQQKTNLTDAKPGVWKFLVLIGLGEIIAYSAITIGFSQTNHTSIVAILSGSFSLPTIVLAYIFLKERLTETQIVGAMALLAGIALVSLT
jgi:drug/metabolite transporter (DMT)-like permease